MGPVRGSKKRKRAEKKPERRSAFASAAADAPPMSSGPESGDWWDSFSKRITGPLFSSKDKQHFECLFRFSRKTFDYICALVKEDLIAKTSHFTFGDGKPLSISDQVAVALTRLSSGSSLVNVGSSFGLNHSTVSQLTWRFIESMEQRGLHHLKWPNVQEMENIKSEFEKIRGLPNCCGAIDTTHIVMCLPSAEPNSKVWLDYEKNHSMILQAVVDPSMRFRDVVTGWPGSMNKPVVLKSSGFYKLCEKGMRLNGKSMEISGAEVREYIAGDEGYPLLPWLLTPYRGRELSSEAKHGFNERLKATGMVARKALARFKEMWKFLQGEMWRPDKHRLPRIILVCCLLHNIIIDIEDKAKDEVPLSQHHDVSYNQQFCDSADKNGVTLRDAVSRYLNENLPT
uniref:DDE Tnp4 domain-containing protein n=1 Tax=Ananas comosus var. bracteatus TaxID=296719 RepID=A0A6V7NH02_ANACO|nr:unnamed protein product [Ananas comosus var. bracteatus]